MTGGPELAALLLSGLSPAFTAIVPAYPPVETMAETVESLDAVLAHAQTDRIHVLGKSYGGFVAQAYVRARPDRVASLVLNVTAVPDRTRLAKHARARWLLHNLPWSFVRWGMRAIAVRTARQVPTERPFWESYFRDVCVPQDRAEVFAIHERVTDFDGGPAYTPADLATWAGRVLVMDSDDDPLLSPPERAAVRAAYPTAEMYRFYGTGHAASLVKPHEFMGVLNRFLVGDPMATATVPTPLTVVFIPFLTETGHLNPTLGLAHDLARRGHRPVYFAMPELLAQAVKQGFSGSPLFPDLPQHAPPAGWLLSLPPLRAMRDMRAKIRRINIMLDRTLSGSIAAELQALKPDVVAVDNIWPQLAFVARRAGIPSVLLSTTPEFRADDARRRTVGTGTRVREGLVRAMFFIIGLRWHQKTRRLARECAIDSVDLKGVVPRLAGHEIPELLLYPREIDDPGASPGRYVGPVIDLDRREPPLDLADIPAGDTLVYCALGSRQTPARRALALFRPIIAAVARRPAHTLILAAGEHATSLREVPHNVRVVDKAPQLAVLSRADVMLTHGGLGSIKESLYFGVPMLVFPLRFDQEANARRVQDRGLGVHIGRRDRTVDGIGRALDEIASNPAYRERVKAVRIAMRALQSKAEATDFFTSLAAHPDQIYSAAKL